MKVNYKKTRDHINDMFDKWTSVVCLLMWIGHMAMATGLTVAFGDRTDYAWYYTRLGIMIIALMISISAIGLINHCIKKRLLKTLDEEERAELAQKEAA